MPNRNEDMLQIMEQRRKEAAAKALAEQQKRLAAQRAAEQERLRRIQEQQRLKFEAARRAAAERARVERERREAQQSRADALRLERRAEFIQTHTVRTGDTPESIADRYGVSPQDVARQVPTLRPGQRLSIADQNAIRQRIEDREGFERQRREGPTFSGHDLSGRRFFTSELDKWAFQNIAQPLQDLGIQTGLARFGRGVTELALTGVDVLQGEGTGRLTDDTGVFGRSQDTTDQQPYPDETRFMDMGTVDPFAEARMERSMFAAGMRYTGQALVHAYELMLAGEDYSHVVVGGTGIAEGNGLYITSAAFNGGTGAPMWEAFSPEMQEKIMELGYREVETGLWLPMTVEPPDYGMGGWAYPSYGGGYGGFGFGGGGDYEYLSRGGVFRRKAAGGASTGEKFRVFPEGVSPTHWRI